jgi:hypothetical protein
MTPIPPLSPGLLASLRTDAEDGWNIVLALLHLIARADKRDQDVAKFVDSYSSTVAALCRRLEALELVAGLRHPVEDAEATESDSIADAAQRITDYAAKACMTVDDWANALNAAPPVPRQAPSAANDPPAAPVDDNPVANALLQAEAALADIAEGEAVSPRADECLHWAETRCTEALAAIRPVMRQHGIRTSEFPPAAPAPAPAASGPVEPESEKCETCDREFMIDETLGGWSTDNPAATCPDCDGVGEPRWLHRQAPATSTPSPVAPAGGLLESIARIIASDTSEGPEAFQGISKDVIHRVAEWLDVRGHYVYSVLLREEIDT